MISPELIKQGISAILGTLGFSLLFGLKRKKLLLASFGGFMVWGVYALICFIAPENIFLCNFIPALVGTLYSQVVARVIKAPATMFIFTSLVVLVPGGMLYYSMRSIVIGDTADGIRRIFETLEVSVALAFGIVMIMAATKVIYYIERRGRKHEELQNKGKKHSKM